MENKTHTSTDLKTAAAAAVVAPGGARQEKERRRGHIDRPPLPPPPPGLSYELQEQQLKMAALFFVQALPRSLHDTSLIPS